LALHALLIGDAHDPEGLIRTLDADEEAILRDAINSVYSLCAATGERPREQLLIDALKVRQGMGELTGANADKLQSLLLRLGPYGNGGTLAHIADSETTVGEDAPVVLFDFTGLSDRLAPALTLAVADYVEWHVHRLRRRKVAGELSDNGPWAGRAQLIIEEGWKPLSSPAAGAWLNEYARRARHYALWLTFITQFFRDFDSEQGRALLSNHAIALCLPNERRDLEHARDTLALTDTDIDEITALPSQKGAYSTLYMISKRGRGAVRIAPGDPEYWIASSNPETDQPARHTALTQAGGDPWKALTLLCDPDSHQQHTVKAGR
jgi:type IV secretory pathway VirB4 component